MSDERDDWLADARGAAWDVLEDQAEEPLVDSLWDGGDDG